ncbi:MAG TPA: hypothetical protein VK908_13880 [Jiangellales bacterium]|nr:hypothetical protein [Jiangellales bacterium]
MGSKGLRGIAIAVLATVVLLLWAGAAAAVSPHPVGRVGSTPPADEVTLVLYHGEGCPHCAAEREWLVGLQDRNPGLSVEQYEVWGDETNRARLAEHAAELGSSHPACL